jgi:autotransporter-associated beta strand protein
MAGDIMKKHTDLMLIVVAILGLAFCGAAQAANVTWDITPGTVGAGNSTVTGGTGAWNTTNGNWTIDSGVNNIAWVNENNDTAVFGGTAGTVTLGEGITVGGLTFNTASYTVTNNTLTFGSAGIISNAVAATIASAIAGSGAITKNGAGTLTLSGANTHSGGTVINSGILTVTADTHLGNASGGITLNGGRLYANNVPSARIITVNGTGSSIFVNRNNSYTTTGKLTGAGELTLPGSAPSGTASIYNFNSTANDFTGTLLSSSAVTLNFNSFSDGAGNIVFNADSNGGGVFNYGASAVAGMSLSTRAIEINSAVSAVVTIQNNNTTHAISISKDLVATGAGAKTLALGATAGPVNVFAGNISNGTGGGTVALTKSGSGTWSLSGTNTYSGKTTNTGGFPAPGTLIFQGKPAVSPNTTFETQHSSGANARLVFLDDSAGVISLNNTWTFRSTANPGTGPTSIFVGNNSPANGGNNPGSTQTGSTIALGGYISNPTLIGAAGDDVSILGDNGYKLQLASIAFPDISAKAAASTFTIKLIPTTAPLIVAGSVTPFASTTANSTPVIQLDGTALGNEIMGAISNPVNVPTSTPLNVTKSSTSEWTLSGTNTYTGGTTITTGKLQFNGADSLPTSGTVAVGAAGHLSLADGTARTQTVSALTLASGASLSFDWTGDSTGDQLTSTADVATSVGNYFTVNLNRSGTPGGSVTLLTGGAGSSLANANYYLANSTNFTATLTKGATMVSAGSFTNETPLTTFYWVGDKLSTSIAGVRNAWALSDGTAGNWSSTTTGYTATALIPGAAANVIFANGQVGKTQQSTVLGGDVTVNSVTIDDGTAVTIAAGGNNAVLTLLSTLSTPGLVDGTPGSAISVTTNAANPTISSKVVLGADQTWHVATNKTLTVGGEVTGNFSLIKASPGAVILNGANTYSGNTTISAGTLRIGNNTAGTLGTGNYAGNIVNNGTLQIWSTANQTLRGVISGSGNLQKAYGGTLTLAGNNTYTGRTLLQPQTTAGFTAIVSSFNSVNGGTPLMASSSLGAPTNEVNGTIELGSGSQASVSLTYTGTGETTDRIINFVMNGNGATKTIENAGSGLLKFTSTPTFSGSFNNDITLQGAGNGEFVGGLPYTFRTFIKAGAGTWTLGGNMVFTGTTTISGGTLELNSGATIGGGTYANAITFSNSSTLRYNSTANQTLGGVISGAGSLVKENTGTLTLSATNTYTGATTINGGTLALGANNAITNASAISIGNATLGAGTYADTLGTLAVTGTATIHLGAGAALAFAGSSAVSWPGTLNVTGNFVSGSSLRFGTSSSGLTQAQLSKISVAGLSNLSLDSNGYLQGSSPGTLIVIQ